MAIFLRSLFILLLLIFNNRGVAQNIYYKAGQKLYLNFSVLESKMAPGEYVRGNDKEQGFIKYNNKTLPLKLPPKNRMVTMRAGFEISGELKNTELAVLCPTQEYAGNIYLNGNLIAVRGNYKEGYTNRLDKAKAVLLPPGMLLYNGRENQIAIQLYPKYGESYKPFDKVYISEYREAATDAFWRNLLGRDLAFAVCVFSIIIFLYYIALYLNRREYKRNYYLYFAILNLAIFFSQVNNAFSFNYQNVLVMEKAAKVGYNFVSLFSLFFVIEFTDIYSRKRLIFITSSIIFVLGAVIMLLQPNYAELIKYYYIHVVLFHIPALLFVTITAGLYLIRKPNKNSFVLFSIYLIEVVFVFHDLFYILVLHEKPYELLIPVGLLIINIGSFFILAWEQTDIFRESVERGKKLKELTENLELIVEERTSELNRTVEDLNNEIGARKVILNKLKEANATKDKLFSIVSHDLKNVFNSLISFSELMICDAAEGNIDNISCDISVIENSSRRAYLFLDNFMQWSASQIGLISPKPEEIELKKMVEDVTELFKMQAEMKKISISFDIPEYLIAFTDMRILQTILRNLISNAIKFSYQEGLICIKAEEFSGKIKISVVDNGIGFKELNKQAETKLNDDSIKNSSEKGTGIGLLLVKELLKIQNGELKVVSEPGRGSALSFTINKLDGKNIN